MNYLKIMDWYFDLYHFFRRSIIKRSDRNACKNRLSGNTKLTAEQKKKIEQFYAPYEKVTTIFHEMYYEKTGLFSEKYIPIDVYTNVIDEYFNPRSEAKYLDNKCYYQALFHGIKQPETALYRMGGFWYDEKLQMIDCSQLQAVLQSESELFLKVATDSYGGKGVKYISAKEGNISEQFNEFVTKVKGDLVAQRPIRQHKDFNAVNESSVNTIRLISLLTEDGPKIYSSIFRVGAKGKKVDNYTSGGLTVGIDENGKLKKYGYNSKGERFECHQSNSFVFEGYEIPSYKKARELVEKAHPMIPHFRLVSFDIAIDEDGTPILLEANMCKGSIEIHEFNNGPLFGDDTKKILDEVYGINKRSKK